MEWSRQERIFDSHFRLNFRRSVADRKLESCGHYSQYRYESVVCEHMPKTATARNKATNWNKGGMLSKKKILFSQENESVGRPETEIFLVRPYWILFALHTNLHKMFIKVVKEMKIECG